MIRIFYGDDRAKARAMVDRILGEGYEIFDGENLTDADLISLFMGVSIFGENRRILVKSLSENKELWEKLPDFLETTHSIVLLESNFDKRSAVNKKLAASKKVELKQFELPKKVERYAAFDLFDAAYCGDLRSVLKKCDEMSLTDDPFLTVGTLTSAALKKLKGKDSKPVKALKILAELDKNMKSTGIDAWKLIKIALMKIANLS